MAAKKKENEDSVVTFKQGPGIDNQRMMPKKDQVKQGPGQSKDDVFETKVTGAANNLHPESVTDSTDQWVYYMFRFRVQGMISRLIC